MENIIKNCDMRELLREIPDHSVDMVLTDPPYGITKNEWDKIFPIPEMWEHFNRILKPNGAAVIFCSGIFEACIVYANRENYKYRYVWDKHYKRNFLNANRQPLRQTEDVAVFYRRQCVYNPKMTIGRFREKGGSGGSENYSHYNRQSNKNNIYYPSDILDFAGVEATKATHPTEKPVLLLEHLIKTYTNPGEIVFDGFAGSGSTCIAALNTGRKFLASEINTDYYNIAVNRIGEIKNEN